VQLAPSFDHASSLGRELQDGGRQKLLEGNSIEKYARRGRGGIYLSNTDTHGTNPIVLVEVLSKRFPDYFRSGIEAVAKVPICSILNIVDEVPAARMSPVAKQFARSLLAYNHATLAGLRP
jgi:hypothetical protein